MSGTSQDQAAPQQNTQNEANNSGKQPANGEDKVTLTAEADAKVIPADQEGELPVLVTLIGPEKVERVPIDLVAVLDVSLSMGWATSKPGQSRLSLLKSAMRALIGSLSGGDRLAIVPFAGRVIKPTGLTEMSPDGKKDAIKTIMGLRTYSDTKFLVGLNHAWQVLEHRSQAEKVRPGYIFLLTDGEDSRVLGKPLNKTYPVHTFGMCHKCNPQSMIYVARETKGAYHPLNDDISNIILAFGRFLGSITSVAATDITIKLQVEKGATIKQIESGAYEHNIGNGEIHVGRLSAHEKKKFIVKLTVPNLADPKTVLDDEGCHLVLTVGGKYKKPGANKTQKLDEHKIKVKRSTSDGAGNHTQTSSTHVWVEIIRFEMIRVVNKVVEKHKQYEEPDHTEMAKELKDFWEEYKKSRDAEEVKEKGVNMDIHFKPIYERLEKEEHVGVIYLHYWLVSHETQQMATMGATSGTVVEWFYNDYIDHMAKQTLYHASTDTHEEEDDHCQRVDFERIDQRLELWSRVKRELPLLYQPSADAESHHLTAVIREASLEAINRAMHHDTYLSVVHASNLRNCYCGKKRPGEDAELDDHHSAGPSAVKPKPALEP